MHFLWFYCSYQLPHVQVIVNSAKSVVLGQNVCMSLWAVQCDMVTIFANTLVIINIVVIISFFSFIFSDLNHRD
jgi:hypothetical protein